MSMSLTEETTAAPEPLASSAVPSADGLSSFQPGGRVLLVWDAPNLDMGLGSILGRPWSAHVSTHWVAGCWHVPRRSAPAVQAS
jgi:hypothetical protein